MMESKPLHLTKKTPGASQSSMEPKPKHSEKENRTEKASGMEKKPQHLTEHIISTSPYLNTHRFVVLCGNEEFGFSRISGIRGGGSFETIREGGVNDYAYALPSPNTEIEKLVFERGMCNGEAAYEKYFMPGGTKKLDDMVICVMDEADSISRIIEVNKPIVESWELSDLDANQSELLIHKMTVIHKGLTMLSM